MTARLTIQTESRSVFEALTDLWLRLRNRLYADAGFQRWAAWFPLTRFTARRRAVALFDLCAGFVYSQVLHACVQLRVLEALRAGPATASELAPQLGLPLAAATRLLDAAAALELVEPPRRGRYGLGVRGAYLLGNPAAARMVEHHALFYRDLADPVALLRGGLPRTELNRFWSYAEQASMPAPDAPAYSGLMADSLSLIAQDILEAYPPERHRCLLDVAGGEGGFLEAAARKAPQLALKLFDLPAVAERARIRLDRAGLAHASITAGDMLNDPLPEGADLVTLVRVIHDHDDVQALQILRAVRRVLAPGGRLVVAEPMADTRGAEPMGHAYFGFYLLAMGQGRPRSARELASLLCKAGFDRVTSRKTRRPMLTQLLVAEANTLSSVVDTHTCQVRVTE